MHWVFILIFKGGKMKNKKWLTNLLIFLVVVLCIIGFIVICYGMKMLLLYFFGWNVSWILIILLDLALIYVIETM
jgi:hypothetical protein